MFHHYLVKPYPYKVYHRTPSSPGCENLHSHYLDDGKGLFYEDYERWCKEERDIPPEHVSTKAKVLLGHLIGERYWKYLPEAKWITFVRDPISRLISHYRFLWNAFPRGRKQQPTLVHDVRNMSFMEFARSPLMRDKVTNTWLKNMPLERFYFVGIMERLSDDLTDLQRMMGWPEVEMPRMNATDDVGSEDAPVINLSQDEREELFDINRVDFEMYLQVVGMRMERMCREDHA